MAFVSHLLCNPMVDSSAHLPNRSSSLSPFQPPPSSASAATYGHLARSPQAAIKVHASTTAKPVEFNFKKYMLQKADVMHRALDAVVPLDHPEHIHKTMRYSLLVGGKRIHPILSLTTYKLIGGRERQAIPPAIAIEIIQTRSLIHDDLPYMDNNDFRHGKPSNHRVFDEPIAILAGDALLAYASYPADDLVPPACIIHAVTELSRSIGPKGLVARQMVDIKSMGLAVPFDLDQLEFIHLHKTTFLMGASTIIGAIVDGGSND